MIGWLKNTSFRVFVVFAALLGIALEPAAFAADEIRADTPIKDKWAVVVGISNFANPSLNLKYPAKDATDFRDFLVHKCNFARDHVKLLINEQATADKVLDVLGDSWLPRVALPDDLVVIFISSHGSPSDLDVAGVNYIVAYDTNPDKLFTTGIPIQHLADTIKQRVHSDRVLVLLDACHSGAATESSKGLFRSNVDAAAVAQGTGQLVVCSSSKNQVSWESKNYPNGVFTHTLIEAFQNKGSNTKLGDAFSYLKDEVQRQVAAERGTLQTPVLESSKWKGQDLIIAAVPTSPRASLPELDSQPAAIQPLPSVPTKPVNQVPNTLNQTPIPNQQSQFIGTPPNPVQNQVYIPVYPNVAGLWRSSVGNIYNVWQSGRNFGWEFKRPREIGVGIISDDGKTSDASWTGPLAGSAKSTIITDQFNRAIKIIGDNGVTMTRIDAR